jgi:RNA polymerase sigma-70 factor (ECF subfamily)
MKLSMNVSPAAKLDDNGDSRPIDETDLIAQARQGREVAWGDLMVRHQEPAFRLAYLMLGDAAEAEDVAQEAFIKAYLKLETFDSQRPFRPWILSITANLARNRKRGIGRYWHALRRWQNEKERQNPASNQIAQRTEAELLRLAVARLKPKWQEVVYLRYFLELSESETAETLDIPPGTVKSRLHRALKQLRRIIQRDFPELGEFVT